MPTTKSRLTVNLDKSTMRILAELSQAQNRSMSAIVAELLNEVAPVLRRISRLLRFVTKQKRYAEHFASELDAAQCQIEIAALEGSDALERAESALFSLDNTNAGRQAGTGSAAAPVDPPLTNRGVATP